MRAARGAWGDAVRVLKAGDLCILALHAGKAADVDQVLKAEKGCHILQFGAGVCLVHPVPVLCVGGCRVCSSSKIRRQFGVKFSVSKHF